MNTPLPILVKKMLFICFTISFTNLYSQTIILSPSGDGGFETGATFATNGWTNTSGTATQNQWVVSTGAIAGFSETRCAYVSQNSSSTPPPHTYDLGTTRATHFYRNITFPSGETDIILSFNWICRGEGSFDKMKVWVVPISYTPVYATAITATGTAPTGRIQVGATNYSSQATWTSTSFSLPAAYAGSTVRLVFEWTNDNSLGTNPPAAIDNISLISKVLTAPANDLCANATTLPCSTTNLAGTTVGSSNITNASGCSMSNYGVWYTFVGDGQQTTITTNPAFDIKLSVSTGTCGSLTNIVCTDTSPETATFTTISGTNYYVYVAYWYNLGTTANTGTFTISRSCTAAPIPPANDLCANATLLPCGTTNLAGTTVNTTNIANVSGCSMSNYGVWYTFVGDGQQTTISTNPAFDIKLSVSTGTCGSLTNIACTDTSPETATFTTLSGTNYYVYVAYWYNLGTAANTGTFTISRSCTTAPVPPVNNLCSNATLLPCGTTNLAGTTVNTSSFVHSTGCTMSNYGVWYTFIGDGYANNISVTTTSYDIELSITSGTCGSLTNIACKDSALSTGTESYTFNTISGTTYRVYIAHWDSSSSMTGNFTISRTCYPPPVNDNCNNAISLTVNPTSTCNINTTGATFSATQSQVGCSGAADDDVWYSFQAIANSHIITVTPIGLSDAVIEVFSNNCSSLSSVACINNTTGSSNEVTTLTGLTIGNIYYIRIYSFANGTGQGNFTICLTTPCSFGTSNGVSSAGCPSNVTGGLGLNGSDPAPINDCAASTCTNLEATYLQLGQTTNYTVQTIPFVPPYQFDCLQNSVSISVDDVWSPTVNIPFNFCFYGNTYNSCLIGSNGVLTFDLVNNSPGGYNSWAFSNNLPSTSLTLNTIFGVYHDIDPSKGGEVGWELVTMPSGCRALVASWSNIPMFSSVCNNLLYTGMIVLYENTNIIEVYIKDKKVCTTWNSGNAVVGVQNINGTQAVVAPNRNSLDPDWTTSNEAWRFTPSGTSITTVAWYEGNTATGPIIGTSSTLNVCPNVSTTYTSKVSYTFCNGSTLELTDPTTITINNRKVWNGSIDSDWNKNNNWTPNLIPNGTDCVTIPPTANNPIISGTNYNGLAGTLSVLNNATLNINSNNNLTVTDWVNVQANATFLINNNSSLIQINNSINTGNIIYKRNTNIRTLDYVYWASPVNNFNYNNISTPIISGPTYVWNTTIANGNGGQGNWANPSSSIMNSGKGYIIRGPSSAPFNNTSSNVLTGTFTGVPNNGLFTVPIYRGNDQNTTLHYGTNGAQITNLSDNWNLLGNPYPSAIRGSQFLFDNNSKIEGNIRLWTHGNLPVYITNPFYESFAYNYTSGDYLTFNFTGVSCCPSFGADLFIGAGQGFFVQMKDGSAGSDVVTFNNGLRSATYDNSLFYRSTSNILNSSTNIENIERNRIWLDLINPNGQSDRTLFGYIENATMQYDSFYDCITQNSGGTLIYSLLDENTSFSIQGRSLPFIDTDEVNIGVNIPNDGNYSIAIAGIDGLFNSQNIYLKDTQLNIIHNIKANPYQFNATTGNFINRFKIIYRDTNLNNNIYNFYNNIKAIVNQNVSVVSNNLNIDSIEVYNILGQNIKSYYSINSKQYKLENLQKNSTALLLKIKMSTGEIVTKRIIY